MSQNTPRTLTSSRAMRSLGCLAVVGLTVAFLIGGWRNGVFDSTLSKLAPKVFQLAMAQRARTQEEFQSFIDSDDLYVMLCGSSSPLPDPKRAGPCTIVMGGGELFIFDAGPASVRKMNQLNVPLGMTSGIFLTHFHSDHIADFGEAVVNSWMAGRKTPVPTYGPPGVRNIVEGFGQAYAMDQTYRTAHHTEEYMPQRASEAEAFEFEMPPRGGREVLTSKKGMKVSAYEVDHWPVYPAVGYRIEFNGRTVLITGDGEPTAELTEQHRGAELVVRNAISKPGMWQLSKTLNETKISRNERIGKMIWDTLDYHSDPSEALEDAQLHAIKLLVICHLAPAPANFFQDLMYQVWYRNRPANWDGKMVFGADGMHWALLQGSQAIKHF